MNAVVCVFTILISILLIMNTHILNTHININCSYVSYCVMVTKLLVLLLLWL